MLRVQRSFAVTALVMGASLAVLRTAVDFVPPAVLLPPGNWMIGYTMFGAVYGALLRFVVPSRCSVKQISVVGALAFGSTFQVLVFSWGLLFDGYALVPLGWPWSGVLLFATLGGISSGVLARYVSLAIRPIMLGAGAFVAFGVGEFADLAVRNLGFPLLQVAEVTLPVAIMVHLVANICCGWIIGVGVWFVLTTRPTRGQPALQSR